MKSFPQYLVDRMNSKMIELLTKYKSPDKEVSLAKGIPVNPENLATISELYQIVPVVRRYRGPRRKTNTMPGGRSGISYAGKSMCLKADAMTVALYLKDDAPSSGEIVHQLRKAGVFAKGSPYPNKQIGETWRQYANRIGVPL